MNQKLINFLFDDLKRKHRKLEEIGLDIAQVKLELREEGAYIDPEIYPPTITLNLEK